MNINDYMIPVSQMDKDNDNDIWRKYLFPNGYEVHVFNRTSGIWDTWEPRYEICVYQNGKEVPALHKDIHDLSECVDLLLEKYFGLSVPVENKDENMECLGITTVNIRSLSHYKVRQSNGQSDTYELPNGVLVEATWDRTDKKLEKVRVKTGVLWMEFQVKNPVDLEMLLHLMEKA